MSKIRLLSLAITLLGWQAAAPANGGVPTAPLLTGTQLAQELNRPGAIYWSDSPMREAFGSLVSSRRVPIWLDRRCDSSQTVNLTSSAPLADSLWQLSQKDSRLDIAWSAELIYVGPPDTANRWATTNHLHRKRIGRLARNTRLKWLHAKPWKWPRLTNPQDLLHDLEIELGTRVKNGHRVTHDLWPAAEFPPLPLFVRLELLAAGFGYTFVIQDDGQVALQQMPTAPKFTQTVTVPSDLQAAIQEILMSDSKAIWSSTTGGLQASWRTHEAFSRVLRAPRQAPIQTSVENLRFTLRAKDQPLERFLQQLAKQLGLRIELSHAAKNEADTMISFEVMQVPLDDLLTAVLDPVQLKHTRNGTDVRVTIIGGNDK